MSFATIGEPDEPDAVDQAEMRPDETVGSYDARQGWATPQAIDYASQTLDAQRQADQDAARALRGEQAQERQQQQAAKVQRIRARDLFSKAGVPTTDDGTTVQPVTDSAGQPITNYNARNKVGWDSFGNPQAVQYQPDGSAKLADPYANAPTTADKDGNLYAAPPGLAWRDLGRQDPDVVEANQDKATSSAAAALGAQASIATRDTDAMGRDLKQRRKALSQIVPEAADAPDLDSAHKAVDDHFNEQYAAPEANGKTGWLNTGDLTDSAKAIRAQIDQRKAQAHAAVDDIDSRQQHLSAAQEQAATLTSTARTVQNASLARKLTAARARGVNIPLIPGVDDVQPQAPAESGPDSTTVEAKNPDGQTAHFAPFDPQGPAYQATDDGALAIDPARIKRGLAEAYRDGHIDRAKFVELAPKAQAAQEALDAQAKLLANDTIASKLKALGYGATKGAAFLAGAPIGAGVGAEIGALGGPAAPVTVPLGAAVGGLITGGLASFGADKLIRKLGQYSDTVKSFSDAADAHPYYDSAGNLIAFGAGLPKVAMKGAGALIAGEAGTGVKTASQLLTDQLAAAKTAGTAVDTGAVAKAALSPSNLRQSVANAFANSGGGLASTVSNFAEEASRRALAGASTGEIAKAIGYRVGGMSLGMAAVDTAIKEASAAMGFGDHQTLGGAAQAALVGAFISGHGYSFPDTPPAQMADILSRARARQNAGVGLGDTLSPDQIPPKIDSAGAAMLAKPITPREAILLGAFEDQTRALVNSGKIRAPQTESEFNALAKGATGKEVEHMGRLLATGVEIKPPASDPSGEAPDGQTPTDPSLPLPSGEASSPKTPSTSVPAEQPSQQPPVASAPGDGVGSQIIPSRVAIPGPAAGQGKKDDQTPPIPGLDDAEFAEANRAMREQHEVEKQIRADNAEGARQSRQEDADAADALPLPSGARLVRWKDDSNVEHVGAVIQPHNWRDQEGDHRGLAVKDAAGMEHWVEDWRVEAVEPKAARRSLPASDSSVIPPVVEAPPTPGPVAADERQQAEAAPVEESRAGDEKLSANAETPAKKPVPKGNRFAVRHTTDTFGDDPIISTIAEHGGLMSRTTARAKWGVDKWNANKGEWDDVPALKHPTHNSVYKPGGVQPDEMAQILKDANLLPESGTVADMWAAIGRASVGAASMRKQMAAHTAEQKLREQQGKRFEKVQAKPAKDAKQIPVESLNVGDLVNVGGEKMKVIAVDPDTYDVTLEDHEKYGIQHVQNGTVVYGRLKKARRDSLNDFPSDSGTVREQPAEYGKDEDELKDELDDLENEYRLELSMFIDDEIAGGEGDADEKALLAKFADALRPDAASLEENLRNQRRNWAEEQDKSRLPEYSKAIAETARELAAARKNPPGKLDKFAVRDYLSQFHPDDVEHISSLGKEIARVKRALAKAGQARERDGESVNEVDDGAIDAYISSHGITDPNARASLRALATVRQDGPSYSQLDLFGQGGGAGGAVSSNRGTNLPDGRGSAAGQSPDQLIAQRRAENASIIDPASPDAKEALRLRGRLSSLIPELLTETPKVWDIRGAIIEGPEDTFKLLQAVRSPYVESLKAAVLDDANQVVHSEIVTIGSLDEAIANPRDIMRALLRIAESTPARRLIFAHNHPSGDPAPSGADRIATSRVETLARKLGFDLIDHVITNGERFFSFRSGGLLSLPTRQVTGAPSPEPAELERTRKDPVPPMAPWETVPRSAVTQAAHGPVVMGLVRSLRNQGDDAGHVFYLNTKLGLVGIERVPQIAWLTSEQLLRRVAAGAMREGARSVVLHFPSAYAGDALNQFHDTMRDLHLMPIRVVDGIFDDASVGGNKLWSAADHSMISEAATPYGQRRSSAARRSLKLQEDSESYDPGAHHSQSQPRDEQGNFAPDTSTGPAGAEEVERMTDAYLRGRRARSAPSPAQKMAKTDEMLSAEQRLSAKLGARPKIEPSPRLRALAEAVAKMPREDPTMRERAKEVAAGIKGRLSEIGRTMTELPQYGPVLAATNIYQADLQRASKEAQDLAEAVTKRAPDALTREAITNWRQAGGNLKTLSMWAQQTTDPKLKAGYRAAMELSADDKALARDISAFYREKLALGIEREMLQEGIANYATQIWVDDSGKRLPTGGGGKFKQLFSFANPRQFDTFFEGEQLAEMARAQKQPSFKPLTKDAASLLGIYSAEFNKVLAARDYIRRLAEVKAADGRKVVAPSTVFKKAVVLKEGEPTDLTSGAFHLDRMGESGDYKLPAHPAFQKWRWTEPAYKEDPDGLNPPVATGGRQLMIGNVVVHPDHYRFINNVLGESAIRRWLNEPSEGFTGASKATISGILRANGFTKGLMFAGSPFHMIHVGKRAAGNWINPFDLGDELDFSDPMQRRAIEHGLVVHGDRLAQEQFVEGLGTDPVLKKIPAIGPALSAASEFTFHEYIPRMKMKTYAVLLKRKLKAYAKELAAGKVTVDQLEAKAASETNNIFGHLNYAGMGRNQTVQHVASLAVLAPDFTESTFRGFADAFTKHGGEARRGLLTLAIGTLVAAKVLNALLDDGDPHLDHPFSVVVGTREYSLRSPITDIMHLYHDWWSFASGRQSPLLRGLIEAGSGKNWRSEPVSWTDAARDIVGQPIPMTLKGLPGVRDISPTDAKSPIKGWEQFVSSLGFGIRRYSPSMDVNKWADAFLKSKGQQNPQTAYPQSKYANLKYALFDGRMDEARKQVAALVKAQGSAEAVAKGLRSSLFHPVIASQDLRAEFFKSLNVDQRAVYAAAARERTAAWNRFESISGTAAKAPPVDTAPRLALNASRSPSSSKPFSFWAK